MLSTGREFDRLFIAILVICVIMLALYTFKSFDHMKSNHSAAASMFEDRLSYMTSQLSETKGHVDEWVNTETAEKEAHEDEKEDKPKPDAKPEPLPYEP